jgi:hypothetical protein
MPPLWLVALIVAAAAPFCAAALQAVLESRLRARTSAILDRALSMPGGEARGQTHPQDPEEEERSGEGSRADGNRGVAEP